MGRTSKRKAAKRKLMENCEKIRYRAGIYARLSSYQDIKKNESVETQKEIARKFVEEFNQNKDGEHIHIIGYYTDV